MRPRHRIVWSHLGAGCWGAGTLAQRRCRRGEAEGGPALCWQIKFNFKPRVSMEINQNNEIWFQIFDNKKLPPIKVVCTVLAVVALLSYHHTKISAITRYTHNTAQPIVEHGLAQMWRRLFTRSLQPGAVLTQGFYSVSYFFADLIFVKKFGKIFRCKASLWTERKPWQLCCSKSAAHDI